MHFRPRLLWVEIVYAFRLCGIARKWLFYLCGIAWKNITERGRGGACVPARVAQQGRIHRSSPAYNACILAWKRRCADVRAGTQAPPLRFRLGRLRVNG